MNKFILDKLFYGTAYDGNFLNRISIAEKDNNFLKECRKKVRQKLRNTFEEIRNAESQGRIHAYVKDYSDQERKLLAQVNPRFKPQGSSVYGTLNRPAHMPPQQVDYDDGAYLPMSIMGDDPVIRKNIFFDIVDNALKELIREEGWKGFFSKDTCARVEINSHMHIDVPLYAIPDKRFSELAKAVCNESRFSAMDSVEKPIWLDQNEVYLAVRDKSEHWKISDPAKVQKWFEQEKKKLGDRFVRVCRYIKAWRDHIWPEKGPSSIALMICVWETFRSNKIFDSDTEALLKVAEELPMHLGGRLVNPGDTSTDPEEIYPRQLSSDDQARIVDAANGLKIAVRSAVVYSSTATAAIQSLQIVFGDRIPMMPDLVELAPIATVVRSQNKQVQPEPKDIPRNLKSG